jgi:DNA-binding CsgD family transcriptional regulator
MSEVLSTRALSEYLLALHTRANDLGYRELQKFALDTLRPLVHFDAALFAVGTLQDGVPHGHDVMLEGKPPEFMTSWEAVKHEDQLAIAALSNPGTTVNASVRGPMFAGYDRAIEHCLRWDIEHALCTANIRIQAGLYWVMSLYRRERERAFSEAERAAVEIIVPHAVAAARQARLGQLRSITRLSEAHGQSAAIVSGEGLVLEAEPALVELFRAAFREWNGPWLPKELRDRLGPGTSRVVVDPIVVRADTVGDIRLLHVRRTVIADQLTAREREIAAAFSAGDTYRQIGERLAIAPNTVRRHLANIYAKLGISSKVELDRMVSGLT